MITMKNLQELSITQLKDTKVLIDTIIKNKVKYDMSVGAKVYIVQKTKKTPGIITKIMQSRCLVKMKDMTYRVPMTMIELRTA